MIDQILPTRSRGRGQGWLRLPFHLPADFARVGRHVPAAFTLRSSPKASRPMPRSWISATFDLTFRIDHEGAAELKPGRRRRSHVEVLCDGVGRVPIIG